MLVEVVERPSKHSLKVICTVYLLRCEACGKVNEGNRSRYERGSTHFCDNKCRSRYKREHPETWKKAIAALNSPESHARSKQTIQAKAAQGEWSHWQGKHHTEETRRHLSEVAMGGKRAGENNGMFGRHHSEEARSKMSEAKSRAILEGRLPLHGTRNKKGWFESSKTVRRHFFRSSWEETVMKYLDSGVTVSTWNYECVRIPYVYGAENRQRWYVPDFLVTFTDGRQEMWEVKPEQFLQTERVKNTSAAGEQYCLERGMKYQIVTGKDVLRLAKVPGFFVADDGTVFAQSIPGHTYGGRPLNR